MLLLTHECFNLNVHFEHSSIEIDSKEGKRQFCCIIEAYRIYGTRRKGNAFMSNKNTLFLIVRLYQYPIKIISLYSKPRNNISVFEFTYVRQTFAENHSVYTSGTRNFLGIR